MPLSSLKQFTGLMQGTVTPRRLLAQQYLLKNKVDTESLQILKKTLNLLANIPQQHGRKLINLGPERTIKIDVNYEREELKKDIWFFEKGEASFLAYLRQHHKSFDEQYNAGLDFLRNLDLNTYITDRDGTVNNYCGRYSTSVQSAYNAVFLSRFALKRTTNAVLLTSAPLQENGLIDISVIPSKIYNYAGSKGREYMDKSGCFGYFPIEKDKQEKIDVLNREIKKLLRNSDNEMFTRIGSGFQEKFGQTTIARQDINKSINQVKSDRFLKEIVSIVHKLDPVSEYFRIEDTGLDVEIILTINNNKPEDIKDFDKGDGVRFLNDRMKLHMDHGPNLICGDTKSDLAMLEMAMDFTKDTFAVFVTLDQKLMEKVKNICPNSIFVDEPDILVSIFNKLALPED